jgi:ubiquinone/menaquinone biosynthesis C-methylase UbiE
VSPDPERTEARFYDDLWAAQWRGVSRHSPLRAARERLMLAEIGAALRPGCRLLDVGSGDGHFLAMVRARYPAVVAHGVDFSSSARQNAAAEIRPLIAVGDVAHLPSVFPDARFDVIVCSEVLEHVAEPRQVLEGIATLLAPGGRGVLTVPAGQRYWSALDEAAGHLRRFEHDTFPSLVREAGLTVVKHYGWGALVGRLYYALVRRAGPGRAAASADSIAGAVIGTVFSALLRIDDHLPTRRGFQLITVIEHA